MSGVSRLVQTITFLPQSFVQSEHNQLVEKEKDVSFKQMLQSLKVKRLPRYIHSDKRLREYDDQLAKILMYLKWKAHGGEHLKIIHIFPISAKSTLVVSNSKLIIFQIQNHLNIQELLYSQIHSYYFKNQQLFIKYFKTEKVPLPPYHPRKSTARSSDSSSSASRRLPSPPASPRTSRPTSSRSSRTSSTRREDRTMTSFI